VDFVGEDELSSLIVEFQSDVLTEIFQRNFCARAGAQAPDLVGPVLEFRVVRNTALEDDRCVFGATRGLTAAVGIASFAMLNDFGRTPQSAYFADAGNVTAVPLDAEFKVFVGIKTLWIDGKFSMIWKSVSAIKC
jgi:hypothetical protein